MSNNTFLPRKLGTGVQLGIGVRDSNLYSLSSNIDRRSSNKWVLDNDYDTSKLATLHLIRPSPETVVDLRIDQALELSENQGHHDCDIDCDAIDDDLLISSSTDETQDRSTSPQPQLGYIKGTHNEIPRWLKPFRDVEFAVDHEYETKADTPISPQDFVPDELVSTIERHDLALKPLEREDTETNFARTQGNRIDVGDMTRDFETVDPTRAELLAVGGIHTTKDLRLNNDHQNIIAYASGKTNSVLNISMLAMHQKCFRKENHNEEEQSDCECFDTETRSEISSIDLRSTIKKIKIPQLSSVLNRSSNILAVITDNAVHFLKVENINAMTGKINTHQFEPLQFVSLEDFPIVDIAFNPWDIWEFAVIDTKGNWCKGAIPKSTSRITKPTLSLEKRGSIFDPEEISSWKRIEWSGSHYKLFVMDRSKFVELDFEENSQIEIVQAKAWSSLRDFNRICDNYCVLLTSKEIIIISTYGNKVDRLLSWKHDLDSEDSTLKLTVQQVRKFRECSDLYYTYVYSSLRTKVLVHCFSLSNGVIQSLGDSFLLTFKNFGKGINTIAFPISPTNGHHNFIIDGSNDKIWCPIFVRNLESSFISRYFATNMSGTLVSHYSNNISKKEKVETGITLDQASIHKILKKMDNCIPRVAYEYDVSQDFANFQNYGYKLSNGINKLIEFWHQNDANSCDSSKFGPHTLSQISKDLDYFENIDEFSSFLLQFMEYYRGNGFLFSEIDTVTGLIIDESVDEWGTFYNKLLQCWDFGGANEETLAREIVKDIALRHTTFYDNSHLSNMISTAYDNLSESHQNIIDFWDNEENTIAYEDTGSVALIQPSSQVSQIPPTIRSSQGIPKKTKKVRRKNLSHTSQNLSQHDASIVNGSFKNPQSPSFNATGGLPTTMTPAFSLALSSQPHVPMLSQSQGSQGHKKRKKRVGGFG